MSIEENRKIPFYTRKVRFCVAHQSSYLTECGHCLEMDKRQAEHVASVARQRMNIVRVMDRSNIVERRNGLRGWDWACAVRGAGINASVAPSGLYWTDAHITHKESEK